MQNPFSICATCGRPTRQNGVEGLCELCLLEFAWRGFHDPAADLSEAEQAARPGAWRMAGDYELLSEIARGGMGIVYRARQISLDREVALKMILVGQWASEAEVRRFHLEAQASARLDHPSIVPIYDLGEHEGWHYFTMKLIEGEDLARQMKARLWPATTRAEQERIARLLEQIAGAVHFAHQRGILHRDLKPTNILLDGCGRPFVSDFGLAKLIEETSDLTNSSSLIGTPAFMAPEQACGRTEEVTVAADIYSLGAILYELLAGRPPHLARTPLETLRQVVDQEIAPVAKLNPTVDADLAVICGKCLRPDPSSRYDTARELAEDLGRWLRHEPIAARETTRTEKCIRWVRRNPLTTISSALLLLVLAATAIVSSTLAVRMTEARNEARVQADENRRRLVNLLVENGSRAAQSGDPALSLPWLVAALREDAGISHREWPHRARLHSVLDAFPKLQALWFHERLIQHAAFSQDGAKAATASYDGTVRVWDTVSGKEIGPPRWHTNGNPGLTLLFHVAFSPDGDRVVSAGNRDARIWDVPTGKLLVPPLPHNSEVRVALFSPDGTRVLTASTDHNARCWDAATGQPVGSVMRHDLGVLTAAWSPDGKWIASGGRDRLVRVWEAETGRLMAATAEHANEISHLEFTPDSTHLATLNRSLQIRIWRVADGAEVRTLSCESPVRQARFSPDGERLLTSSEDGRARVWNWRLGKVLQFFPHEVGQVVLVDWSRDGRRILTASSTRVRIWDAESGEALTPPLPHTHTLCHAEISRDGARVLVASLDGTARLWSLPDQPRVPPALVRRESCGAQNRYAVLQGAPGVPALLDLQNPTNGPAALPPQMLDASGHAFDAQARHLGLFHEGWFTLFRSRQGKNSAAGIGTSRASPAFEMLSSWEGPAGCLVALNRDATVVALYGPPEAGLFDAFTGRQLTPNLTHTSPIRNVVFSPDGTRVLTVSDDSTGRIWESSTGRSLAGPLQHENLVTYGAFSHDGRLVVTASHDGTARVWTSADGEPVLAPLRHRSAVLTAVFSPDQRRLATVTDENVAQAWELHQGGAITPPMAHSRAIQFISFLSEEGPLLTITDDLRAWLWELPSGLPLTLVGIPVENFGPYLDRSTSPNHSSWSTRIPVEARPLHPLERWSLLLTGHVVEGEGALLAVEPGRIRAAWAAEESGLD